MKYWVWDYGDTFNASASNGKATVYQCYGSTPETAKEMALVKLKNALNRDPKEQEIVTQGAGFAIYRDK